MNILAHYLFIQLLIVTNPTAPNNTRLISSKYFSDNNTLYETSFQIGTPLEIDYYSIDIVSSYTWMVKFVYHSKKSTTKKIIDESSPFKIAHYNKRGTEIEDTVALGFKGLNPIESFPFFIVSDYGSLILTRISGLGFAFKFTDEKYSLLHQLKKQNHIDHAAFSLVRNTNDNANRQGTFNAGGMPIEDTVNKTHSMCHVIKRDDNVWGCNLTKITIDNTNDNEGYAYNNDKEWGMHFNTINYITYVPKDFIEFLLEYYFKEAIEQEQCELQSSTNERRQMKCATKYISTLPNITWVIDGYEYEMSADMFFDCGRDDCYYLIGLDRSNEKEFVLGNKFLKYFDLLFDYEKESIHFYTNDLIVKPIYNKEDNRASNNSLMLRLLIFISIIIIIGMGILSIWYCVTK